MMRLVDTSGWLSSLLTPRVPSVGNTDDEAVWADVEQRPRQGGGREAVAGAGRTCDREGNRYVERQH